MPVINKVSDSEKELFENVKGICICFVIPCMVKLPSTKYPCAVFENLVEMKLMVGYFSASNHLLPLAWLFFRKKPVAIDDASTEILNDDDGKLASSKLIVPLIFSNFPEA